MIADRKRIRDNAFFTTLPIINNSYLSGVKVLFPAIEEQRAIASYLDTKCSEIDSLIVLKQQKIDCVVLDEQPAKNFAERNDDIKILPKEFTLEDYAFCIL